MQEERLRLRGLRVGALPILNSFIERMGLEEELTLALKNRGYAHALLALLKNIVVDRNALYAVGEWVEVRNVGFRDFPDKNGAPYPRRNSSLVCVHRRATGGKEWRSLCGPKPRRPHD